MSVCVCAGWVTSAFRHQFSLKTILVRILCLVNALYMGALCMFLSWINLFGLFMFQLVKDSL